MDPTLVLPWGGSTAELQLYMAVDVSTAAGR